MSEGKKKLLFLIFVWLLAFIVVAWSYQVEGQTLTDEIEKIKANNPITYYFDDENEAMPYPIIKGPSLLSNPHYGETSKCLGQFRDNFFNTSFVSASENLVFNTSLGFVELEQYNASGVGADMWLWTGINGGFTEVDPAVDHLKRINNTHVWFDDVDRDEGDRLYKDFGAGFFDSSFHYHFRVYFTSSHTDNARCYFMAFSEETLSIYDTRNNLKNYCGFFIWWKGTTARWELELRMFNSTVPQDYGRDIETEDDSLDLNKWYHVDYLRVGTNVSAWFYNDANMTDLDFLLTLDVKDCDNLRYFHPLNAENQASGGRAMDLNLNKVRNMTAGIIQYRPFGYFITTDYLLSPIANGICLNLMTNCTQGNFTSMSVQFSPDNSTWYNNHNASGFNSIVDGFLSLDMRYLNFTSKSLFRYNFTRGADPNQSPELWQSRLLTSQGLAVTPSGDDRFIIGLVIGIALLIIAYFYVKEIR